MSSSPLPASVPAASFDAAWLVALNAIGATAAIVNDIDMFYGVTDRLGDVLHVSPSIFQEPTLFDALPGALRLEETATDSGEMGPLRVELGGEAFVVDRRRVAGPFSIWTFEPDEKGAALAADTAAAPPLSRNAPVADLRSELLDVVPGMIYRCRNDRAWTMEYVSQGALDLCGHTAEEIQSGDVTYGHDVIFSQDQERVWNDVQDALAKRQPFEVEYRIIRKDGSVRWAFERGRGVFDDAGALLGLDGLIIDATNNQVIREELRYARYLLRAVYDASPDALVIFSERGAIVDANEGFTRLFGYTPDSLVGFDPFRLIPRQEDHTKILAAADQVIEGAEVDFESHLKHEDGSEIPVELRLRRFEDDMGRRFVVSLIRDQREQRAAKEELQRSEQRYRQMFEGNHAVKLLIDPQSGALMDANIAASQFYGYDLRTLLSMKIQDINAARSD